ncbi:hypothetical protein KEM56_001273 [Ascosphaera pollenicola]|nr:hypothetical protein KEM56_001273 [Ascosphaera pollenicola]
MAETCSHVEGIHDEAPSPKYELKVTFTRNVRGFDNVYMTDELVGTVKVPSKKEDGEEAPVEGAFSNWMVICDEQPEATVGIAERELTEHNGQEMPVKRAVGDWLVICDDQPETPAGEADLLEAASLGPSTSLEGEMIIFAQSSILVDKFTRPFRGWRRRVAARRIDYLQQKEGSLHAKLASHGQEFQAHLADIAHHLIKALQKGSRQYFFDFDELKLARRDMDDVCSLLDRRIHNEVTAHTNPDVLCAYRNSRKLFDLLLVLTALLLEKPMEWNYSRPPTAVSQVNRIILGQESSRKASLPRGGLQ